LLKVNFVLLELFKIIIQTRILILSIW